MNSKGDKESEGKDRPVNLIEAVRAGWDEIVMRAIRDINARYQDKDGGEDVTRS